jgi:uncharacterized oxidoreductase
MKISGNTIFMPGSTSGIGLGLAVELEARGNTVIIGGWRTELLERIAAEHPGVDAVQIDTTDAASIASAAKEVLARHPDLNVLAAMAGIMRVEDWHQPGSFLASAEARGDYDQVVGDDQRIRPARQIAGSRTSTG